MIRILVLEQKLVLQSSKLIVACLAFLLLVSIIMLMAFDTVA